MEIQKEQIAPELFQAIVAKAAANGLTVNDYLAQLIESARAVPGERISDSGCISEDSG
jgi:hypothetical protein